MKKQKRNNKSTKKQSNPILEKMEPSFEFADVIMMGFMSYQYLKLWINPQIGDAHQIFQYAGLMGFEFIMVHSGVFMAVMPRKISLLVFVPLYGLFAWAFNEIIGEGNIVAYVYLIAVFNRMRFAFFNTSEELKNKQIGRSVFAVMTYFFLLLIVGFGNQLVPKFGLNETNLIRIGYDEVKTHGGLLLDEPQIALCLGTIYYFLLALYGLPMRWFWKNYA